jgi:phage gp46-like protein
MADVRLYQTADGGEIDFVAGQPVMSDSLETAAYLSLFGGNERDNGLGDDNREQWWGNLSELDLSRRYRSETQNLLRALPLIPANLRRLEEAATRDLAWIVDTGLASAVAARATMPKLNRIALNVTGQLQDGTPFALQFDANRTSPE